VSCKAFEIGPGVLFLWLCKVPISPMFQANCMKYATPLSVTITSNESGDIKAT